MTWKQGYPQFLDLKLQPDDKPSRREEPPEQQQQQRQQEHRRKSRLQCIVGELGKHPLTTNPFPLYM
ncbi:uncharacterized protein UTRI_03589 [Ustilago trichophora]|uniref:Uncharacterized protein n=1 Tax=Ustilago trichophora TaxID=86804 RepID=A0A5C3E4H6_9BASI|nr:uncharacterized protein UTRI_03589 [Ustilago trichophora]